MGSSGTTAPRARAALVLALAVAAAAPGAASAAVRPTATFEGAGRTVAFGGMTRWCEPHEGGTTACMVADMVANPSGPEIGPVAYPFTGTVHFSAPPESVVGSLRDMSFAPLAPPVGLTQLDADSWAVSVPGPHADSVKLQLGASFSNQPTAGAGGTWFGVLQLVPPPPVEVPPPPVVEPAPLPPRLQMTVAGAVRRGSTVVVRIRTSIAGRLGGGVRQAGKVRAVSRASLPAGSHRFVLRLPKPRVRAATVTLRLTDAAGDSVRIARTLR